jgi:hypothetical protein
VEQVGQLLDGVIVFGRARHNQHVKNCSHVRRKGRRPQARFAVAPEKKLEWPQPKHQ